MKKLIILDDFLGSKRGHFYEYDKSIYNEIKRRGWECEIYCLADAETEIMTELSAIPFFEYRENKKKVSIGGVGAILQKLRRTYAIGKQYKKALQNVPGDAIVFIPNIFLFNVFPISWALWCSGKKVKASLVLYRESILKFRNNPVVYKASNFFLKKKLNGRYFITTDSEVVANECKSLLNLNAHVLPIPHIHLEKQINQDAAAKEVRIFMPGEARIEKGVDTLLLAIEYLIDQSKAENIHFVIQFYRTSFGVNDREASLLDNSLGKIKDRCQITVLGTLSSKEYSDQMMAADVILTPYKASSGYFARTSGIFAEALAYGKPVIVTQNTWMSIQLHDYGSGIAVEEGSFAQLGMAIDEMKTNIHQYKIKAESAKDKWLKKHNSVSFCNDLFQIID